jgi:hypothetical protein
MTATTQENDMSDLLIIDSNNETDNESIDFEQESILEETD